MEPCGTPLSVLLNFHSSMYPASRSFLTRLRNRPSWICESSCRDDEIVIEASKAVCYVSLYDPDCAFPGVIDFSEGGMTPPFRSKSMGVVAECRIEVGIQDHSHHLCQQFVAPNGHAERPLFPVFLGYVCSSRRLPLVSFLPHCLNDISHFFQ
jgi:hypothetical protein